MFSFHPRPFNPNEKFGYAHDWLESNDPRVISLVVWSPIIWAPTHRTLDLEFSSRKQSNFSSCEWLVMDFDGPTEEVPSLAAAKRKFCDMIHFIGTTKSHQKEKGGIICDRFRVVLKFEKLITDLRIFRWNMRKAIEYYGADKACIDGARFYYPCVEMIQSESEGYDMEVDEDVPYWFEKPVDLSGYREAGVMPQWLMQKLLFPFPTGHKNTTCYQLAKDLTKLGFDEKRILSLILNNPSYRDGVSEALHREICQAIKSGHSAVGGSS